MPVTLEEIARISGFSKATVSLALRNQPAIRKSTRQKIHRIAQELGYRPNPLVAAHMAHIQRGFQPEKKTTLAFVSRYRNLSELYDKGLLGLCYEGARSRSDALGFKLDRFWSAEPGMTGKRMSEILRNRGIKGVVISPTVEPESIVDLDWQHLSASTIGYTIKSPEMHRACHNNYQSIQKVLAILTQRKYGRIGFVALKRNLIRVNNFWSAGFLDYQRTRPENNRIPMLLMDEWTSPPFTKWLNTHTPDVILSTDAEPYQWLRELNVRVPQDMGFATVFWLPQWKHLSGIDQNIEQLGSAAIDLVVSQLYRNETGLPDQPKSLLVPGTWHEGNTLRS